MATKAWIFLRLLIHSSSGLTIFVLYGLIDWLWEHAAPASFAISFAVLTFFTAFLTWADVLKLYVEPRLTTPPAMSSRPWRQQWRAFLDRQVAIRKAIYGRTQREHEANSFMASSHMM